MKFELEKALHEIIRDLPEAEKINRNFKRGTITTAEAFREIWEAIQAETDKARGNE